MVVRKKVKGKKKKKIFAPDPVIENDEIMVEESEKNCHLCPDDMAFTNAGRNARRPLRPIKGDIT